MIVELFGPSGVGKTTLSHALASVLRSRGYPVGLICSARPSEQFGAGRPDSRPARFRPHINRAAKAFGALAALFPRSHGGPAEAELMSMLTEQSLWTRVRYRRYLLWLRKLWADARPSEQVTIFDQGYLSALCSIVCRHPALHQVMPAVLDRLPKPDILVCVHAPDAEIEARLRARLERLGPIARRLELDISTTLRQVAIAAELRNEVARNKQMTLVCCSGFGSPPRVAQAIVDEIEALPSAQLLPSGKDPCCEPSRSVDHRAPHYLQLVVDR